MTAPKGPPPPSDISQSHRPDLKGGARVSFERAKDGPAETSPGRTDTDTSKRPKRDLAPSPSGSLRRVETEISRESINRETARHRLPHDREVAKSLREEFKMANNIERPNKGRE